MERINTKITLLIVVIFATSMLSIAGSLAPTRPFEAVYCNETKATIVSLIKDVLESEQMKEQYNNRFLVSSWL
jgi:hypothetical protein